MDQGLLPPDRVRVRVQLLRVRPRFGGGGEERREDRLGRDRRRLEKKQETEIGEAERVLAKR